MLEEETQKLWGGIALPPWDARELWRLFQRHAAGQPVPPSPVERDRYARLLMQLASIQFVSRGWMRRLPRAGIDPRDAAGEILAHWLKKTPTLHIRVAEDPSKPERECVLALLAVLNLSAYRRVMTLIGERRSKVREGVATDVMRRRARDGAPDHSLDALPGARPDRQEGALDHVGRVLRAAEDGVCAGVPGDIDDVVVLARYLRLLIVNGEANRTTYRQLPRRLLARVNPEQHALVLSRTLRITALAAASFSVGGH